jgi:hypothetical protein
METASKKSVLTALDDAGTGLLIPERFQVQNLRFEVQSSKRRRS